MVQYKYFHNSSGYVYRLSIGRESQDYMYMEKLFQTVRSMSEGNTFTYAALSSGGAVMMQSTSDSMAVFSHGIVCDSINDYPSKYINRLETEIDDPENPPQQLPDADLPGVSRRAPEFPTDKIFHDFVPKIADALIRNKDNKQILIVTENREESERFMGAISTVLPKQFMARIGFCIGVNSLATSAMKVVRPNGESEDVSIKIWLPELMNYRFETFANAYYVFDAKAGRDNYSEPLCSTAQVLSELNLSDSGDVGDYVRFIAPSFSADGSFNADRLEALSAMYLLNLRRDYPTAVKVLETSDIGNPEDIPAINVAVSVMLDEKNSSEIKNEHFEKILAVCVKNEKLGASSFDKLVAYLKDGVKKYKDLSDGGRDALASILRGNANIGECLEKLFDSWWFSCASHSDYEGVAKEAFALSVKMLDSSFNSDCRAVRAKNLIPGIVRFFNKDVFASLKDSSISLFTFANEYPDNKVGEYALAILMSSAYISNDPSHYKTVISKLQEIYQKLNGKEQFNRILEIKKYLVDMSDEFDELEIKDAQSFLLNTVSGNRWCEAIVGVKSEYKSIVKTPLSDSLNEMFDAYRKAKAAEYPGMYQLIGDKLTDIEYIKAKKLKAGSNDFKAYKGVIDEMPESADVQTIRDYIIYLEEQGAKSKKHGNDRFADALKRFNHLYDQEQAQVLSECGIRSRSELETLGESKEDKAKIKRFVEIMNKKTGHGTNKKKKSFLASISIGKGFLWTIIFPIISLVLMLIPGLIISLAIPDKTFFVALNIGYFNIAAILIPIFCVLEAIALILVYLFIGNDSRKSANTVFSGILLNVAVLIFVFVCLVLFFVGAKLGG